MIYRLTKVYFMCLIKQFQCIQYSSISIHISSIIIMNIINITNIINIINIINIPTTSVTN